MNQPFTYESAMEYIKETEQYGSVLGLEGIAELLKRLSNPHDKLKFIHVAGTNGKGSVSAYISSILAVGGYKVGRYVSPVIRHYCERIQISERKIFTDCDTENCETEEIQTACIAEDKVAYYLGRIKDTADIMVLVGHPHPTVFEIETAMSFLYFVDCNCDIVVLEVGLGGRLDATNVIKTTVCSVFTSISMDHMQFLGDTLEKIACEKAGIIKESVPVVSYEQEEEAGKVIRITAEEKHAELTCMSLNQIQNIKHSFDRITFDYKEFENLQLTLLGENQVKNAALAVEIAKVLIQEGYHINKYQIAVGLKLTKWFGRFEMILKNPYFFIDGAHNEDAAKSLAKSIRIYFQNRRLIYILGVFADKDYGKILQYTAPYADMIITITPDNPRALPSGQLAEAAGKFCNHVINGNTIEEALEIAVESAEAEDVILAFGSLSFLGNICDRIKNIS